MRLVVVSIIIRSHCFLQFGSAISTLKPSSKSKSDIKITKSYYAKSTKAYSIIIKILIKQSNKW